MIYYRNKRDIVFNADLASNWEATTTWLPADVAGGVGSTVVLTNTVQTAARTITVNQDVSLSVLKTENTTHNTAITTATGKKIYIKGLPNIDCKVIASGGTKSIAANFELADNWEFDNSAQLTLSGVLSGSGDITKKGSALFILGGTNTFTGNIYIEVGNFRVSSDNNLGNSNNNIYLNGGTFLCQTAFSTSRNFILQSASTINTTSNLTINGVISGTGNLTKTGGNSLILTGTNTFTGTVIISQATLSISSDSNLGDAANAVTFSGGILLFTETLTFSRALTTSSGVSNALSVDSGKTIDITSTITCNAAIQKSGSGIVKFSNGTTTTGTSNFLSSINAGTAIVNGTTATSTATTTIQSGATLMGTGNMKKPVTVASGGNIEPGDQAVGTLTVTGNTTINGKLTIRTSGATAGKLAVTGNFTANLTVELPDTVDVGTYDIVTWTITGTNTSSTIGTNSTGKTCSLTFDGTNKKLQLVVT